MGVEEMRMEERAEEKAYDWLPVHEGLFCRLVLRESTLDALWLEGGWRCLMDGRRLDTGVGERERVESWQSLGELRWCRLCLDEQHVLKEE